MSPQTVLDWNVIAVNTVRAATPAKFQIEGQLYMTYVQAAVYDAVAAIKGKEDGKGKDASFRKLKLSMPGASHAWQRPRRPPTRPSSTSSRPRPRR